MKNKILYYALGILLIGRGIFEFSRDNYGFMPFAFFMLGVIILIVAIFSKSEK
ncbi:hypothetical protein [Flavobacterium sp.]|uniref:hypothetical protein n=1 Tax=Flavobacterium sp. TaxID=239 RepID=UPI00261C04A3|nr:hypothetical protein [Flavobacterium sp.]